MRGPGGLIFHPYESRGKGFGGVVVCAVAVLVVLAMWVSFSMAADNAPNPIIEDDIESRLMRIEAKITQLMWDEYSVPGFDRQLEERWVLAGPDSYRQYKSREDALQGRVTFSEATHLYRVYALPVEPGEGQ